MYGETRIADEDFTEHYERDQAALDEMLADVRRETIEGITAWLRSLPAMQAPRALADEIEQTSGHRTSVEKQEKAR